MESESKSQTLPPSPSHSFSSSSSSDFEFTVSLSPLKSSSNHLCPADELFYKGQLLPLHLSPRLSMVRTLLLASSSTSSSSDTTTTASRDSTGSSTDSTSSFASDLVLLPECDSSRPSSVAEDDDFKRLSANGFLTQAGHGSGYHQIKKSKYFSFSRLSSVFRKDSKARESDNNVSGSSAKRVSSSAREVIRKYLKKVKPLYEKLSQKQQCQQQKMGTDLTGNSAGAAALALKSERSMTLKDVTGISVQNSGNDSRGGGFSHSFSGNLRYPRRRRCVSSCPSSMRSSPTHSGVLCRNMYATGKIGGLSHTDSTMEELQSAIQGAIAHCKNSMIQSKSIEI